MPTETVRRAPGLLARWAVLALLVGPGAALAQQPRDTTTFTHADTLRGSNGPERAWWDATFYDLHVAVHPSDSTISGWNAITYRVRSAPPRSGMQIDLQQPLAVDSIVQRGERLRWRRDGNALFVVPAGAQPVGASESIAVYYHGKPVVAVRPPWDGGLIWQRDSLGNRWVATANEGLGASVWWPNKDWYGDEPDSQRVAITVPDSLADVSNGRLRRVTPNGDGTTTWEWFVTQPINNYDVEINAGRYAHFADLYDGEAGVLTMDFWPLAYHEAAARRQWPQARPMMRCFESWFGPYPWYEDGYKLIEAPHLGMEHQSGVAYGNGFGNGYLGRDLSATGWGTSWDFIIVHESAHEWWGNSLTMQDAADMWIHESFANYAEALYVECRFGKVAGAAYQIGTRRLVRNDRPIVGAYGVNHEGSGDMYYKGGNMLHTIRQVVNDDARWRAVLRGAQRTFRHQTITGAQLERYMSQAAGVDLSRIFQQYLTTTKIPVLEYRIDSPAGGGHVLAYRWADVVPGFDMPVAVTLADSGYARLHPTTAWQTVPLSLSDPGAFRVDPDFFVIPRRMSAGARTGAAGDR